jgi:hypothetical protein
MPDEVLGERAAARYLEISLDRLRQEVNAGRLACSGTRRLRQFSIQDLDRWRRETKRAKRAMPQPLDLTGVARTERRIVASLVKSGLKPKGIA